jgi:hypothetical protein
MRKRRLNAQEQQLLRETISKYLASEAERLSQEPPDRWLSALRISVREAVGKELAASGFDSSCEPTERGYLLEGLIDYLNFLEFDSNSNST